MSAWPRLSAIALTVGLSAALGAGPAAAAPTATFDGSTLRVVTASSDVEVDVAVFQYYGASGFGNPPMFDLVGDVAIDGCQVIPGNDRYPPEHHCSGIPSLAVLDGGPAWAELSYSTPYGEGVAVRLKSGERGGRLSTDVQDARFIGRDGPDVVTYTTLIPSSTSVQADTLVVRAGKGDDLVTIRGPGVTLMSQNGSTPALVQLGRGNDEFLALTVDPAPVWVVGGDGADTVTAGPKDVAYGQEGPDVLVAGRQLWGGPGQDWLQGGPRTRLIRAQDGQRDVVNCTTHRTVAFVDAKDAVNGPCEVVVR